MAARFCTNCGRPLTEAEAQLGATTCGACTAPVSGIPSTPAEQGVHTGLSPIQLDYHVTGQRIAAALIDIVLFVILFFVMAALLGDVGSTDEVTVIQIEGETVEIKETGNTVRLENGPFALYIFLVLGYYVLLERFAGATLGKMVMGLRVAMLDGKPYGWGAVLLRNVLRIIDGLPLFYLVGIVSIAATEQNQRLGDLAARATVVRAR